MINYVLILSAKTALKLPFYIYQIKKMTTSVSLNKGTFLFAAFN